MPLAWFLYFFEYFLGAYLFVINSLSLPTKLKGSESEKMDFNSFLQSKNSIILIPSLMPHENGTIDSIVRILVFIHLKLNKIHDWL